jgi:hypothetical protein
MHDVQTNQTPDQDREIKLSHDRFQDCHGSRRL